MSVLNICDMLNQLKNFIGLHADFAGFLSSMICAVHCSVLPIFLSFGLASGLAWMQNPIVEVVLIGLSLCIAVLALYRGYKHHHASSAIYLVIVGFLVFILGLQFDGIVEMILTTVGGLTIATAHVLNWRLSKNCTHCHH